jgi:ankyrin repeat protein
MARTIVSTLIAAAAKGDLLQIKKILRDKAVADKCFCAERGSSLLYTAARLGHADIARFLICEIGADVNVDNANDDGSRPLHGACYGGHAAIAQLLLEHGAVADHANKFGETALHNATSPAGDVSAADKRACVALFAATKKARTEPAPAAAAPSSLQGKTLVFTGTLVMPRAAAKKMAADAGAKVTTAVSGKTDYLVTGPLKTESLLQAKAKGVAVIDEATFVAMAGGAAAPVAPAAVAVAAAPVVAPPVVPAVQAPVVPDANVDVGDDGGGADGSGAGVGDSGGATEPPELPPSPLCIQIQTAMRNQDPPASIAALAASGATNIDLWECLFTIACGAVAKPASKQKRWTEYCKVILDAGFDPTFLRGKISKGQHRKHPLWVREENPDIIRMLVAHGIQSPQDPYGNGMTFVHTQILMDKPLNMGAYLDALSQSPEDRKTHQPPLLYACRVASVKCAEELLRRGCDVNKVYQGSRGIDWLVRPYSGWSKKREELVRIIVAHKLDLTMLDKDGKRAVDNIRGKNEIVKALLTPK